MQRLAIVRKSLPVVFVWASEARNSQENEREKSASQQLRPLCFCSLKLLYDGNLDLFLYSDGPSNPSPAKFVFFFFLRCFTLLFVTFLITILKIVLNYTSVVVQFDSKMQSFRKRKEPIYVEHTY